MAGGSWLIMRSLRFSGARMKRWLDGVASLGWQVYYPMVRELRPVPRRRLSYAQRSGPKIMRPSVVPFLPGIIFARGGDFWTLADHPGVLGFVTQGSDPARISDEIVARLRERETAGGGAIPGGTPVAYIFHAGERVTVVNGAFANQTGIVELAPDVPLESIDADTRLRLTLGGFKVSVSVADIRKP
jgi:hypothetical protein